MDIQRGIVPSAKTRPRSPANDGTHGILIAKPVRTTPMFATPGVAGSKSALERFESWNADSDSTEPMTPDATTLIDYKSAAPGFGSKIRWAKSEAAAVERHDSRHTAECHPRASSGA